ncbi:EAL domain, c-di-GMP-specific phosphodiesterase class I (or its enzymatically inactive variant) [Marinobacter persicus]|uniref:EAL domain, c-di-GMP-specific phosphodiesterase class I (Or its enzymatically inactive variant) n=1 Tax=Marinobacter persicus TaxID=930118 RepID=A0A1I3XUM2_9GAMM|nr:sensor domain-containing phosphodiesterase [Marinobacter persicus]GHD49914.1 sensor domain-containing phosphodiesterase [Marinobacter persicus]SFK23173.1 EAL domain, c-di-GMP-specific phosphodiesterase class I (or its enzymatically inactive variant) [Marinobacter persicus]
MPHRDLLLNEQETRRLEDLYALDVLDTPPEERFDRITRLAKSIFGTPVALVSLLDRERQWFKSNQGLAVNETPRSIAICEHTVREASHLVIPNLSEDERFRDNPLVTEDPKLKFYAGAVLRSLNGHPLGTLCILDYVPRQFSNQQVAVLQQIAAMVERELNEGYRLQVWRQSLFEQILYQHDGLPGERLFAERCERTLAHVSSAAMVVMGINEYDLSMLELPSDQQLLLDKELAHRVALLFETADHVATLGHGRYAALYVLDNQPATRTASRKHMRYVGARALQKAFAEPLALDNRRLYPTVGVSMYPDNGQAVDQLLIKAELARPGKMARSTRAVSFYDSKEEAQLQRSVMVENRLREAIANNRLRMNYQPKFDLASGQVSGLEALVRWHDAELGEISPAEFIPIAENTDIIRDLTDWVLAAVCHQYSEWRQQGVAEGVTVAVNLSADDLLRPNFLQWLRALLDHTGMPASALILEITEGSLIDNVELAAEHIREAKALGLSVHIDDFGTGYSSLSQLHRLPLDALKVDRSFVHEIGTRSTGEMVTTAIISLAKSLRLSVVAEGIETEDQLAELRKLGCDSVQGFLLSRPLEAGLVASLLGQRL